MAAATGDGASVVSWTAPAANGAPISSYSVTPIANGTAQSPVTFPGDATSETLEGLSYDTSYTFEVTAQNARGTSPSSVPSAAVDEGPQPSPVDVTAVVGDSQIATTWQPPGPGNGDAVLGYKLTDLQGGAGGIVHSTTTFGPATTNATVTGLNDGTFNTVEIQAMYATGLGPAGESPGVIVGAPGVPSQPQAVGGNAKVTLSWAAGRERFTHHRLRGVRVRERRADPIAADR